jgi:hypothetical protein
MGAEQCKISSWTSVEGLAVDPAYGKAPPRRRACESSDIANNSGQSPPESGGRDEYQFIQADATSWRGLIQALGDQITLQVFSPLTTEANHARNSIR